MEQILENIAELLKKDFLDYVGIFSPIILSFFAIIISIWNSFLSRKFKSCEVNMIWDDFKEDFYIFIRNTGKKTLIIKSVSLFAYDNKNEKHLLGIRQNAWTINRQKSFIEENEAIFYIPAYGSNYDVFSYRGHFNDVTEQNKDWKVKISATEIDNKEWTYDTYLTLGDIEEKLKSRDH